MSKMIKIGKVAITEQEILAFEIINLRSKAEEGKSAGDYLQDAASYTAKAIINIITDDVDEYVVACGCKASIVPINLQLIKHEESIGDNVYKCWYDIVWNTADGGIPETIINLKDRFGYIFGYASTYFSEELVSYVVKALSNILGESSEEKTKSEKSHLWQYEVE